MLSLSMKKNVRTSLGGTIFEVYEDGTHQQTTTWYLLKTLASVEPGSSLRIVSLISKNEMSKVGFLNHILSGIGRPKGPIDHPTQTTNEKESEGENEDDNDEEEEEKAHQRISFYLKNNVSKDGYVLFLDFPFDKIMQEEELFRFLYLRSNHFVLLGVNENVGLCEEFMGKVFDYDNTKSVEGEMNHLPSVNIFARSAGDHNVDIIRLLFPNVELRENAEKMFDTHQLQIRSYDRNSIVHYRQLFLHEPFDLSKGDFFGLGFIVSEMEMVIKEVVDSIRISKGKEKDETKIEKTVNEEEEGEQIIQPNIVLEESRSISPHVKRQEVEEGLDTEKKREGRRIVRAVRKRKSREEEEKKNRNRDYFHQTTKKQRERKNYDDGDNEEEEEEERSSYHRRHRSRTRQDEYRDHRRRKSNNPPPSPPRHRPSSPPPRHRQQTRTYSDQHKGPLEQLDEANRESGFKIIPNYANKDGKKKKKGSRKRGDRKRGGRSRRGRGNRGSGSRNSREGRSRYGSNSPNQHRQQNSPRRRTTNNKNPNPNERRGRTRGRTRGRYRGMGRGRRN